jgi:uncharacterized protein YbjQ (UPF0145 family)
VTLENLPGFQLRAIIGEVVGVTARPQNPFMEGVGSLDGTLSTAGEHFLMACRREAIERMVFHARKLGANAVLGMRFDHRVVSADWVEICAYGTAVVAVRKQRLPRPRRQALEPPPQLYEATMTNEAPA